MAEENTNKQDETTREQDLAIQNKDAERVRGGYDNCAPAVRPSEKM